MSDYCVVQYTNGAFTGIVAGHGKNKGTWDTCHSRSSAYRLRKEMMTRHPDKVFKVERAN